LNDGARRSRRFSVEDKSGLGILRAFYFWTLKRRERRAPLCFESLNDLAAWRRYLLLAIRKSVFKKSKT
jgi:hypothetical protein